MPHPSAAALPIAFVAVRVLIVLNWLAALAILALLLILPNERWIMTELALLPGPEADRIVSGLRFIAVLGLAAVPLNHIVLARLAAMIGTVRAGDPFVAGNAARLRTISWVLLALQVISVAVGAIATRLSAPGRPIEIDAGFSIAGWLAVLFTFVLARVFDEGTRMRDDLEGTV